MVDERHSSEGWYVHLSVRADESARLLEATRGIVDDRGASLVASRESGLKELVLFSARRDGMPSHAEGMRATGRYTPTLGPQPPNEGKAHGCTVR
jgi:hypothetical protein